MRCCPWAASTKNRRLVPRLRTTAGLDGTHGVLIPARNQRHLMLDRSVLDAVERGLFHVYTMGHVSEGIALLTGEASGMSPAGVAAGAGG